MADREPPIIAVYLDGTDGITVEGGGTTLCPADYGRILAATLDAVAKNLGASLGIDKRTVELVILDVLTDSVLQPTHHERVDPKQLN